MTPPRWLASIFTPQNKPVELEAGRFEELFEQNWEPVCRLLFRLLGDWDEAEDLTLEAFLELHRNPPRENQNLPGWLYRVALNRGLNALRARDRRRRYEQQSGLESLRAAASADPAQDVERKLEGESVRAALQKIKPRSARLLLLRYSGLSYAEIASALDLAPGSVGSLLARAEQEFERVYSRRKEGMG